VQFKGVTVRDLLQMAVSGGEAFLDEKQLKTDKYLKAVGLEPELYLDREVNASLSGGELKRIEIASVLARGAELSIFDEPEAGIDIWSFDNLVKVFRAMRKADRAIVIISHQERIMKMADRIIVLKDGKVAQDGPSAKVLAQMEDAK
jgi:Fe-S cluster assembly ATP-binding protein